MFLTTLALATCLALPGDASLEWYNGPFMNAVGAARSESKPIMIYFWSDQSGQCSALWNKTLSKPEAATILDDFTMVSANTADKAGYKLVERFGVTTLPTLLVLDVEGHANDAILGAIELSGLADEVARIERGEGTVKALRAAHAAAPEELELLMKLAIKLGDVGDKAGFEQERSAMYAVDPKFKQLPTAKMRLWQIQGEIQKDEETVRSADLQPAMKFLKSNKNEEVLYSGWQFIAGVADYREDVELGLEARKSQWKFVPESDVARTGFAISSNFYEQREALSKKDKKFALKVANASLASVESWSVAESECPEGCYCGGCTEGCVGEGEMLAERQLYLARALDNLACALSMNGKRRDALAANDRSLEIDPENEVFLARKLELKS